MTICQQLNHYQLPFTFINAVDGRKGLPRAYLDMIDRDASEQTAGRPLSDAEYACALSHRSTYKYIVDNDLDGAIILEDDAIIGREFQRFFNDQAYIRAPMILLYHSFTRVIRRGILNVPPYGTLGRVASRPRGAVAYCIDNSTARHLLSATTPIRGDADWPVDLYKLGAWALCPKIVRHPEQTMAQSRLESERRGLQNIPHRKPFSVHRPLCRRQLGA